MAKSIIDPMVFTIGLIGAGAYAIYKFGDKIFGSVSTATEGIGEGISSIGSNVGNVADLIGSTATGTKDLFSTFFESAYNLGKQFATDSNVRTLTTSEFFSQKDDLTDAQATDYYNNVLLEKYPGLASAEVEYLKSSGGSASNAEIKQFEQNYIDKIESLKNQTTSNTTTAYTDLLNSKSSQQSDYISVLKNSTKSSSSSSSSSSSALSKFKSSGLTSSDLAHDLNSSNPAARANAESWLKKLAS